MIQEDRVYRGRNAVRNFLNPHTHPAVPLVELPPELNPFYDKGVHIFAKMMTQLPLANVKSVPAYNMLVNSDLADTSELVEASSGNTVLSLAVIAKTMGINSTRALVSREVSRGKLMLLRLCGVTVEIVDEPICPDPGDPKGAIAQAKARGKEDGVTNLGQYSNEQNPHSHASFTGPQILQQLSGKVDYFAAGLGTTGTLIGVSDYLKEHSPHTRVVGVARMANNDVPGVRTANLLSEVEFDWKGFCDVVHDVGQRESYLWSLKLIRWGLLVGPSSGFALTGLIEELEAADKRGDLSGGKVLNAVFICPDTPFSYMEKYFSVLGEEHFSRIVNSELLNQESNVGTKPSTDYKEISIEQYCTEYVRVENKSISKIRDHVLIDVREPREFVDHHIGGSTLVPLNTLKEYMTTADKDITYVFVCKSGNRSATACQIALENDVAAYTLSGGTAEWSKLGLPRVIPDTCPSRYQN